MEGHKGRKEAKRKFIELFRDYCSKSTIHGVQYVGDPERPIIEKLYWIAIFIVSSCCNFYLIWQLWYKWQISPVIVSFAETTTPVWQVPFPAITVCSQSNSRVYEFSFSSSYINEDMDEIDYRLGAMSLVCDSHVKVNGSNYLNLEAMHFLNEIAPGLDDVIQGCKMANKELDCQDIFKPVFTEDGLCFTSNVIKQSEIFRDGWSVEPYPDDLPKSKHWTLEQGYERGSPIETYPVRALNSGDKSGLLIVLAGNKSNHDSVCRGPIPGYKIILHNPAEIPSSSSKYIRIPNDQEILVWVQPNIMTTSNELRSYSSIRRQCFYPDERQLKYFKIYTERNCELECLTNYTMNQCECVAIYMPRNSETPVCGSAKKQCTIDAVNQIRFEEVKRSYEGGDQDFCNCLPACTAINYQAETSQTNFDWYTTLESTGENMSLYDDFTMSRITLFFGTTHFTTSHRSELFGIVDFLANCGGLLGLFSGISFLSFLEIFYFSTLRPWGNLRNEKEEKEKRTER